MRIEEYASLDGRALASLMGSRQVSFAEVTEATPMTSYFVSATSTVHSSTTGNARAAPGK